MASVAKTIEIIFAGTDKMSSTLGTMGQNLDTFGTGLQDIGAPFADATEKVLLLEAALVALVAGGFALAVIKAGEFKSGMAEVNSLLNITDTEFQELSAGLIAYSTNSTASMTDLQLALYNLISLGGDYKTSLEALSEIEKLSIAAKADLTTTTETLIGTMNAYGAGIDQASNFSDAFFTIIQDGKTTLPELATSIAQVTGIAATAGIDFETLGAAIAAMTAAGAPTSQAITSIKAAIQALIAPTKLTSEAAEALGIQLGQTSVESQGFEVVLKQIYDATNGDIEIMKTMIPSIEGLSAASILGADSAGILAKALVDMKNNTGATEKAFEKMKDNLDLTWQTMVNNFDAIWIKFGLSLGDGSTDLIKGFTGLFKSIADGFDSGEFDEVIAFINKFLADLTKSVSAIATNMPEALKEIDFTELIKSLEGAIKEIQALFKDLGIDLTTVEGLSDAIQLVVDSVTSLQNVTGGIIDAFAPMITAIKEVVEWFGTLDADTQKLVGQILGFGAQLTVLAGILATGGAVLGGLSLLTGLFASSGILATGLTSVVGLISGPAGLVAALTALGGVTVFKGFDLLNESLNKLDLFNVNKNFADTAKEIASNDETLKILNETLDEAKASMDSFGQSAEDVPKETTTTVKIDGKDVAIEDITSTLLAMDELSKTIAEPEITPVLKPDPAIAAAEKLKATLENKLAGIELQGDIDIQLQNIVSSAETLQSAFEWKAKLNIAEVESAAKTIEAAFASASATVDSLTISTSSMFGDLISGFDDLSISDQWKFTDLLNEQIDLEKKALDSQIKLTDAQVAYMDARTAALAGGKALITIDSTGLEPALEMIMFEILDKIQIKASEEASEFLLGI